MEFSSLDQFAAARPGQFGKGPFAMVIAEDQVELGSTLDHLARLRFRALFVVAPPGFEIALPAEAEDVALHVIRAATRTQGCAQSAVNALIAAAPGEWIHYCFNGEYLFFPFCEDRSIGDLVTWVMEERRNAVLTFVVDLYAADLTDHPNAVSRETAMLDASGYYAETRRNGANDVLERQLNFFGGLRWRFEEHVTKAKRKIDRVGLFRAAPGLILREDHTLSDDELNTYECPWHNSLTAAVASFRVAKALRTNPGSMHDIDDFRWHRSEPFQWSSLQLMELGLMEPGQWF